MKNANTPSSPSHTDHTLTRRAARELAFQFLFGLHEFKEGVTREEFESFCSSFENSANDFSWELISGTLKHTATIREKIATLSKNWRLERMPRVDLAILSLASFEILFREDIPKNVSINEAIELAKRFGSESSASFVNGILDKLSKAAAQ